MDTSIYLRVMHVVVFLLLLLACAANGVRLTATQASCVLEAVDPSGYQEGLVPFLRVKLFIHGTATFSSSSNQVDTAWGAFNITNISNSYKFFPRRASSTKDDGVSLATYTFPLTEYSTQAGDIQISYTEMPFQPSEFRVNTSVHITSFVIPCLTTVKPYLYNAHVFGTVAEFLFTEPVVRCNDGTNATLSKDWLIYSNRACEAGTDAEQAVCARSYPRSISLCANDLKPVNGNTMRWWCNFHGNVTDRWPAETYFIQYYLVSGVVCAANSNATVTTFYSSGVKVFRQQEEVMLIHPVLIPETTNVGRSNPGYSFVDIQFQFPINATEVVKRIHTVTFDYAYSSKTARCTYHSDAGFPDGQMLRYQCYPRAQLQISDVPYVAVIAASATPYLNYYVLNYSATADLGVDFINYTSGVRPTTEVDGVAGALWTTVTPTIEWILAIYYINETTLKLVPSQTFFSLPVRTNLVCYDTDEEARYDIVTTVRNGSSVYLSFSEDAPLPAYAPDFIHCYFLWLTPSGDDGHAVYPANAVPVTLEPETAIAKAEDDSIFASLSYNGSLVLLIILAVFSFLFFLQLGICTGRAWKHRKEGGYKAVKDSTVGVFGGAWK